MLKFLTLISISIMFSSCSSVYADRVSVLSEKPQRELDLVNENLLLLLAMDYESRGWTANSSDILLRLYQKTDNSNYAYEYLLSLNKSLKYQKVIDEFQRLKLDGDRNIGEYAKALLSLKEFDKAEIQALKIKNRSEMDYKVLAMIYINQGKTDLGLKSYTKGYEISKSPADMQILIKLYSNFNRAEDGIKVLEYHCKNYKFNSTLFQILGKIYMFQNRDEEALEIYKELYKQTNLDQFVLDMITALKNLNRFDDVIKVLEDTKVNDEILLQLYMSMPDNFKKGVELSEKLYKTSGKDIFLIEKAILEYKLDLINGKSSIKQLVGKIEKSVTNLKDSSYLNYLGYLMIENSYRVKDGLELIRLALEIEPDNYYIIDSLAWGQYRTGNCKEAFKTISKVVDKFDKNNIEFSEHLKDIKLCKERKER